MKKQKIIVGLTVLSLVFTSFMIIEWINYPTFQTSKGGKKIIPNLQSEIGQKTQIMTTKKTETDMWNNNTNLFHRSVSVQSTSKTSKVVKSWTYMLYLDADNDIERDALWDFEELERGGGTNEDINVIVLFDRVPGYDSTHGDWTGSRYYLVTEDISSTTIDSILLEDLGEANMGDPETLKNFLNYCFQYYPAEKYCLDLWDHGWGAYGLCPDETSIYAGQGGSLTLNDLQTVILNTTATHSTYLDIVSMDACDMCTLEVAWELRDLCDYFIASEGTVNVQAYNYSAIVEELKTNPTSQAFCEFMVLEYSTYYMTTPLLADLSVIDQGKIKQFLPAFNNFIDEIMSALSTSNYYQFFLALARQHTQEFLLGDFIDLIDFINNIKELIDLEAVQLARNELITALDQVILYQWQHRNYGGVVHGLSIFLPNNLQTLSDYENQIDMCANFEGMDWKEDSNWDDFIDLYRRYQLYNPSNPLSLSLGNQTQDYLLAENMSQIFEISLHQKGTYEFKSTILAGDVDIRVMWHDDTGGYQLVGGSYLINPEDGTMENCRFYLYPGSYYVFVLGKGSTSTYSLEVNLYEPLHLTCNQPLTASGGTTEGDGNGHFKQDLSHYFQIELPTGNHSIVLKNSATTNYQLTIYNGYGTQLLSQAPPGFGNDIALQYNITVEQLETILLEVRGFEGVGNFTIEVITTAICTQPGDSVTDPTFGFGTLSMMLGIISIGIITRRRRKKR